MTRINPDDYLTVRKAAELVGMTEQGVRYQAAQGNLEIVEILGLDAILRKELLAWAAKRREGIDKG